MIIMEILQRFHKTAKDLKEQATIPLFVGAAILPVAVEALALNFKMKIRTRVRERQNYKCGDPDCEKGVLPAEQLTLHHIFPRRGDPSGLNGSDEDINGVALCREHHLKWDEKSREGIYYPGIPFEELPEKCFNHPQT